MVGRGKYMEKKLNWVREDLWPHHAEPCELLKELRFYSECDGNH